MEAMTTENKFESLRTAVKTIQNKRLEEDVYKLITFCELYKSANARSHSDYVEDLIAAGNALEDFRYKGDYKDFSSGHDSMKFQRLFCDLSERLFVHVDFLSREQVEEFFAKEEQFLADSHILKEYFRYRYLILDIEKVDCAVFTERTESFDEAIGRQEAIDRIMQEFLPASEA